MTLGKDTFRRINLLTLLAIYLLILVGGIVRNLESGMGCPDWPLCFGKVTPPANEADLPENYKSIYQEVRVKKTERLSAMLESFGFSDLATKMREERVYEETEYDFVKAWVEYGNRLVGVLIGFLVLLNGIWSYSSRDRTTKALGLLALLLVLFQGWIGSVVVSTNLLPGLITFHMLLAILLVMVLLVQRSKLIVSESINSKGKLILILLCFCFLVQIVLGTWVREQVDVMNAEGYVRTFWIEGLDAWFYIHRSFSILIFLGIGYLFYLNRSTWRQQPLLTLLIVFVALEIVLGAIMTYFSFPVMTQPLHLVVGTISFGLLFSLFLQVNNPMVKDASR